jgi:hypothetical protein
MSMTINNAIARGLYAEPTNDITLPFAFVRDGERLEPQGEPEQIDDLDRPTCVEFLLRQIG